MQLYNNTPDGVLYSISSSNSGDCGNIDPNGTADLPAYDNQENVYVAFSSTSGGAVFEMTIPETKPGMVVTMGMYFE